MSKSFIPVLTAALLAYPAASFAATLQTTPGGTLTGATDVVINGELYDVQFQDGTINSVFGSTNPADFDFQSGADALAAANALLSQVLLNALNVGDFDTEPDTVFGIGTEFDSEFYIPYGFSTVADLGHPFSINALARNHAQEFLDSTRTDDHVREESNTALPFTAETLFNGEEKVWARFTPVPEPSSLALLALGGFTVTRRRRRG